MLINLHTHHKLPDGIQGLTNIRWDGISPDLEGSYSIGIHPWDVEDNRWKQNFEILATLAEKPSIKAIGECGFDTTRGDRRIQEEAFIAQVALSEKVKKPLIIHSVGGSDRVIALKKALKPQQSWIIHSFVGKNEVARSYCDLGIYLSFSPFSLSHLKSLEVFKWYPAHLLFLESDDSTTSIEDVYQLAQSKRTDLDFNNLIYNNYHNLFKLND